MLVAAGLALGGKKAFAHAIAPFITLRPYELIKMELAAMGIPVTLVGVGAGFSYSDSGPTHHMLEDIGIMRILPKLKVHSISDSVMAAAFADVSYKSEFPNYVRLDRQSLPVLYMKGTDFSSGLRILKESDDLMIIATGNMVHRALDISEELKSHSIQAGVIDLFTFPIDEPALLDAIAKSRRIVTLEEHFLPGGMGSAVVETLADNGKLLPVKRIGVDHRLGYCYKYGGRENIQSYYGLDKKSIVRTILKLG
mgnify:FL=1